MNDDDNYLTRRGFITLNVVVAAVYVALAWVLGGRMAIEVYNAFLFGAASGVIVAYLSPAYHAIRQERLYGGDMLRLGIFMSWSAVWFARIVSIIWRFYGQPPDWLNSVAWGLHIPGSLMAAYAHIISPAALDGKVPTRRMVETGFLVMFATTISALLFVVGDAIDLW